MLAGAQREALHALARSEQAIARLTLVPPRWMPRLLELPDAIFARAARRVIAIDPSARSSMWDDLEAGRPTEIDFINGEVVALGAGAGVATPINDTLVTAIREAERGGRRDFTGRELADRCHI